MLLSIVIPCYNEARTIRHLLLAVQASPAVKGVDREIIVVDDGSNDGTQKILQDYIASITAEPRIHLLQHAHNRGKGAALRTAFARARGDIILVQDADLEYDPSEHPKLIATILSGQADVVYGSRFSGGDAHRTLNFWHRWGNGLLTFLSNMTTNLNLSDMETCFKAFRRELLANIELREEGFGIEPEITAKLAHQGCRINEVSISYYGRTYAEGKKICWKDGLHAIVCIFRYGLWQKS